MAGTPWSSSNGNKQRPEYTSLDDMIQKQESKMELLKNASDVVLGRDDEVRDGIKELEGVLREIASGVKDMKEALALMKDQNGRMQEGINELNNMNAFIECFENNPEFNSAFPERTAVQNAPSGSKAGNRSRTLPVISLISESEFKSVPSYVKGRMKLDDVNIFIRSFNDTLSKKYAIIKSSKLTNYNDKQMQFTYKQQQLLCPNTVFCTEADLKSFGFVRPGTVLPKMLNVLRAAQRVKETRAGGNVFLVILE